MQFHSMNLRQWLVVFVLVAALPAAGYAQTDQGRLSGTVRDKSGSWVAGAQVTVRNEATGEIRNVLSSNEGLFVIPGLKPAVYTIRVEKQGFAPIEYTKMPVAVGQELTLDFKFEPAGVTESITVTAEPPVLDMSSARMGANVSPLEVNNLPVNGRQMSQLLLQAPGAQNSGTGTWQDIRFSGRAVEQNAIRYDGIEGSAIIDASPGNVNGENNTPFKLQASLENVQEFRVESSAYPAEYGTGTGGQVSVVTKSGSNSLHGAAFEYARNDAWDARNYFDSFRNVDGSVVSTGPKSPLSQHQFGGSAGGPLARNRAFFFTSYERYQLEAGRNFVEAVPSAAAWATVTNPAILATRPYFMAPGAVIIPGAASSAGNDIAQYQATQKVTENAFSARVDFKLSDHSSTYVRVFRDDGTNDEPQGVTGRRFQTTSKPTNVVFNLQNVLSSGSINEFKFGYNAAKSTEDGVAGDPALNGVLLSLGGTVANAGIAGQSGNSGVASPGGLVRVNSAGNGRSAPYDPYSLTLSDSLSRVKGAHFVKMGAEFRAIRMTTDQQGGTTYTFTNQAAFLANTPSSVQYFGDLSEPSPFNNGATGPRHTKQEYYIAYVQDEWRARPNVTLNLGLRYDYYTPMSERDNRISKFNIDTGTLDPNTTPFYKSKKTSFQPRVSATYSPTANTVFRSGFGIFVGPGQTEDQIQPIEADRISLTVTSGPLNTYPTDPSAFRSLFSDQPNNRSYQPRAYSNDYTLPERVYQYTASMQQELPGNMAATVAYVGSQGRNLFLRSIANRTIGVVSNGGSAATQIREFDIVTQNANGTVSVQRPFAEIDYKTSGGHDSYNGMQLSLTRRSTAGFVMNAQYTYGFSKGNTGGSNEATTASNNARTMADFDFENGYNNFDVRHTFNLSMLYALPFGKGQKFMSDASGAAQALLGGWNVAGIINARSGVPVQVTIVRNDIVYVDPAGNVWNNAAADRTAVINVPGGGFSRSTRRPDLIPGVDPYTHADGLLFVNPAAFATPKPGTWGNLERNLIHGPTFRQTDFLISKKVGLGRGANAEFRVEIFNIFNVTNFGTIVSALPNSLPNSSNGDTLASANRVQPGQPYTSAAAGQFGRATSTVGTTVGLGTPRQVQLAFRLNF